MRYNSHKAKAMRQSYRTVFGGPLEGYDVYGATTRASLLIGRKTGLETGPVPEGKTIPKTTVVDAVMGYRATQVGRDAASTVVDSTGYYKGDREPSMRVDLAFVPNERERSFSAFQRNIKKLAQVTASALGQREILIEWVQNGRTMTTATATPLEAPSPLDKTWCSWVRANSKSARTNKADPCYRKPRKR